MKELILNSVGGILWEGASEWYGAIKCKTYMPLKEIRGFEHMGVLGASGGI